MLQQPELGKKIADLRKAKGWTQEELVEKCNLNVRTLQRIEGGEVTPRPYTIRLIFEALEFSFDQSLHDKEGSSNGLRQFYRWFIDLFNLKTNTMKKVTILTVMVISMVIGLLVITSETKAQKAEKVKAIIENNQRMINKWLNNGQIDSVMSYYRADASVLPAWTGKAEIRENIQSAIDGGYKLLEFKTVSVSVGDTIAVQKYYDVFEFEGNKYQQQGLTEWRLTKGKWLIVNDIMSNY